MVKSIETIFDCVGLTTSLGHFIIVFVLSITTYWKFFFKFNDLPLLRSTTVYIIVSLSGNMIAVFINKSNWAINILFLNIIHLPKKEVWGKNFHFNYSKATFSLRSPQFSVWLWPKERTKMPNKGIYGLGITFSILEIWLDYLFIFKIR